MDLAKAIETFQMDLRLDEERPAHKRVLQGIQGNILKSHGRNYSAAVFVTLQKPKGRGSIREELVEGNRGVVAKVASDVWSADRQRRDAKERRDGRKEPSPTFYMLAISGRGYERIGEKGPYEPTAPDELPDRPAVRAFRAGMANGGTISYAAWRPEPESWEPRWVEEDDDTHSTHWDLLILIAHDDESELRSKVSRVEKQLKVPSVTDVDVQQGRKSAREKDFDLEEDTDPVEHFGFRDGISGPVFFERDRRKKMAQPKRLWKNLEHILWPEENGAGVPLGTFLSVLKLDQNVRAFYARTRDLQSELGLRTTEEAEALCVGRRRDGQPLVVDDPGHSLNDFDFENDPRDPVSGAAKVCPAAAHIRRMNQRRNHDACIVRRSFHYGRSWLDDPTAEPPSGGVGLMFMAMSRTIDPFATLMSATQRPKSPHRGGGVDALIGRTQATSGSRPRMDGRQRFWDARQRSWVDFRMTDFVTPLGGEYFFVPSIDFLKSLGNVPRASLRPSRSGTG